MSDDIQKLREATGAGVMDCKRALIDAKGNFDKAVKIIRDRGLEKAEKKSGRATGAGVLESYIHAGRVGVLIELRCETDFVARAEPFKVLAHEIAMQIAAMNPENVETLLAGPYIKDEKITIKDLVSQTVTKVGENIQITRFCRYEL